MQRQYRPAVPTALARDLRARGFVPPDYDGGGLLNLPATVLEAFGVRDVSDPPPLRDLDPALLDGARQIIVVLADGLGWWQLELLTRSGAMPFVADIVERARRRDHAQLIEASTIFPSTTAAALTTMHTARSPQEHGNLAYFCWVPEFRQVTQMLRWGRAQDRRGSYFDDARLDPRRFVRVPSIHSRLRERGVVTYVIEPDIFRNEAMNRMHSAEARYLGYMLPTTMGVRIRELLVSRPHGTAPAYAYAYWSGIDSTAHVYGPRSAETAAEAASLDLNLRRALGDRAAGDTLVILTADHGHAETDPEKLIGLVDDAELAPLLRHPLAGEPRLVFIHTTHAALVRDHLETRWPGAFTFIDREEAIAAGLFGSGDPSAVRERVGEVCALLDADRGASIVRVGGEVVRHRGSHGGMTADEMRIPILAWRV